MWQRFTERARRVVCFAQEEAGRLGENYVSTEHLLLGLVRENDSAAARILERLNVSCGQIRSEIEREVTPGDGRLGNEMQLTPRAKRVIDLAYDDALRKGLLNTAADLRDAIYHGAVKRVRPKAMTAAVIIAGLLPILWSHGAGADVMKRIATPMIGGVVTSTIMELIVYPAIFYLWRRRSLPASTNDPIDPTSPAETAA